ncbi:MAG TPA: dephospho-CoA kinase [Gemmatimonadales bacterium]|nr:dephospho-CoA kinase [Gemmatimonadales bacterium]
MFIVGLTGNIAAGKSTVVDLWGRWGATIIDADLLAREAQAPGGEVLAAIVRRFGGDVLTPEGALDRAALRSKVMGDQAALEALNQIVHPAVRRRRDELIREARERGDVLVVNDIPLLFEVLDPGQFDAVVLVDAAPAVRRTRLRGMRGLSNEDADRLIAAQMPAERKRPRSHFVIPNDGTVAELEQRARGVFEELRRRAAVAALGRPARALVLAAAAGNPVPALSAIAARYTDAGLSVHRVAATAAALGQALGSRGSRPDAIVATAAAARAAAAAWERAGRPGVLASLSDDPDPVAVRLDLRPWGYDRVRLVEPGGSGLAPRPDLFPAANPLA